ncbi:vWA domain-containing protein [Candidatus Colwellia aromaticivorans]|uniref:vWA domain-containing protein n=1 Tax=Candidatus Colwellia aromaticivorans TaxID=2267621 RepID=UPI000DF3C4DA|nr:VWA domain-containing protein [Candidatus Colwellia aromaticivorans]
MTSYNLFLAHFHFVRPFWLLAIIVLFLVLWQLKKHRFHLSPWQKFLPPHLSGVLVEGASNSSAPSKQPFHERIFLIKPFLIGLLSIIALAGPAWQKLPQPVYQTERGSVLIMDMSYSMYATDIKPNRLTRARFKAVDLLNKINDGDVGLVAYAGDAFVISPLTQDVKNIELLLPSLTPEIMPELGANSYAALTLAHEMLTNAGHLTGDIYWFTDDVDNDELSDIFDWSSKYSHRLNILGIGSPNGAPIKLPSGELLKDDNGAIVVPRLPTQKLQSLASRGQGNYQTISNGDSDIDNLILTFDVLDKNKNQQQESQQTGDQWQEQGAWLLLLVLPLALSYFRRGGAILLLPLTCLPFLFLLSFSLISPVSYANEETENTPAPSFVQKTWQDLWQTNDQQAQRQYNQEDYQSAAQLFENSQWQGSAHYKAGNYQEALDAFTQGEHADSANSLYNQGNALAQMQKYQQAIDAYEQALKKNPDLQDAKDNMEKLKQQQKQEQEKSDQSKDDKSKDGKSEDQGDKQQKQDNDSQQQEQDESDKNQEQQSSEDSDNESQQQNEQQEQKEQSKSESEKKENEDESKQKQEQQAKQDDESTEQDKEKTAAQIAAEQQAKETTQKHQQLLNKVTDDPYLLLRNKMQLEYKKRRQDGAGQGVKKKW